MPMELRKRKAPAQPPAPAPAKKTKTVPAKKKAAPKAEETKKAVAPAKKAAAKKEVKKAVEKKEAAPVPAPAAEKAPEPEVKPDEAAKPEAPAAKEPAASASTAATAFVPIKTGRKATAKATKDADAKADAKAAKADAVPKLKVGDALPADLAEITLDDGTKTTFDTLLDASEKGIVLFSYTKASTSGCITQACALRDNYAQFKDAGYLIYGLSADSHTDNAKFKTNKNLGYPLLSDPTYVFHEKLGIKGAKGTVRSVIVVQKEGKIIKELKTVQPKTSLDAARKAVGIEVPEEEKKETKKETKKEKEAKAKDVAVGKEPPAPAPPAEAPAATTEEAAKPAELS